MNILERTKQEKRNLRRKVDDITDLLFSKFSSDGEDLKLSHSNFEHAAECIMSEVFGINIYQRDYVKFLW